MSDTMRTTAMKKKIQYSRKTRRPIERPGEQLIELPSALRDSEGDPVKRQKSYTTHFLNPDTKSQPTGFSHKFTIDALVLCVGGHVSNKHYSIQKPQNHIRLCKIPICQIYIYYHTSREDAMKFM